jgi:hypothetical protein
MYAFLSVFASSRWKFSFFLLFDLQEWHPFNELERDTGKLYRRMIGSATLAGLFFLKPFPSPSYNH